MSDPLDARIAYEPDLTAWADWLRPRSFLDDPNLRRTFNSTAIARRPERQAPGDVQKIAAWFAVSEEMFEDLGYEPSFGYWDRELARAIERRRLAARLRRLRRRLQSIPREALRRLTLAARALAGERFEEDR